MPALHRSRCYCFCKPTFLFCAGASQTFPLFSITVLAHLPVLSHACLPLTDLGQATRVANSGRERLRVVSLGGELIDTSGTMSGGGSRPQSGGMSSKFAAENANPRQLQADERQLAVRICVGSRVCSLFPVCICSRACFLALILPRIMSFLS